jgi:uncharacterized protein (TIGR02145 family)
MNKLFSMGVIFTFLLASCGGDGSLPSVKIGSQKWSDKNLDVATFRNGEPIYEAKTEAEWKAAGEAKKPACCFWQMNEANGVKFGRLYNYYAVKDPRGLAPKGWHIPTKAEWKKLEAELEKNYKDGTVGSQMKSISGWRNNKNGNNKSGFNALPSECVIDIGLSPNNSRGHWWAFDESLVTALITETDDLEFFITRESDGNSIRCVKD